MKKLLLLTAIIFAVNACADTTGGVKTIRLSHPQPESHPIHTAGLNFAKAVEEKTEGRYIVKVFPNSQLGTPAGQIEMAQTGVVELVMSSFAVFEGFNPKYKAFNLPYLYTSRDHFINALYTPEADEIYKSMMDTGFLVLAPFESGFRNIYSKKPVRSIADMKGLKFRVQESDTMIRLINSLGGQATPLAYGEVFTAIQQNVLDGAENNPISYVSTGHFEVAKFYSITEHVSIPDGLVISTKFYNSLSEADQAIFKSAAMESTKEFSASWEMLNKQELDKVVKENGVEVITVDKAPFLSKVEFMQNELASQGKEFKEVIDYINSKQ